VPSGRKHFFGELCERKPYMESAEMEFEGERFLFPKNYDDYLKNMYGNYMEIPPVEKREHHVLYQLKF
jgi:lipopolysaccharide cholinephosphotransferase